MIDAHAYNITIRYGSFEGEDCFEARVKELPDIAEYADTYDEAYLLAIDAINTTALVYAEKEREMPRPHIAADDYSGRITLRLPTSLHRALVETSDIEGVSLNYYIVNVLSYFSGYAIASNHSSFSMTWKTAEHLAPTTTGPHRSRRVVQTSQIGQNLVAYKRTGTG